MRSVLVLVALLALLPAPLASGMPSTCASAPGTYACVDAWTATAGPGSCDEGSYREVREVQVRTAGPATGQAWARNACTSGDYRESLLAVGASGTVATEAGLLTGEHAGGAYCVAYLTGPSQASVSCPLPGPLPLLMPALP